MVKINGSDFPKNDRISPKTVAVIGAGVSGLAAVKSCLEYGLLPTCYELKSELGGIWAPVHPKPDWFQGAQVYEGLITNTCKYQFSFSDFPHPKTTSLLLKHQNVLEYLKSYSTHFNLSDYLELNTKVIRIEKASDYDVTGRWTVTTQRQDDKENERTVVFNAVLLCCGQFGKPSIPRIEETHKSSFLKTKGGTVVHSGDFWSADDYAGRSVAVVGAGVSGVDIACILAAASKTKQVHLICPNGTWILPLFYKGRHSEYTLMDYRLNYESSDIEALRDVYVKMCKTNSDYDSLGLASEKKFFRGSSNCWNTGLDHWIYSGRIKIVRDSMSGFTESGIRLKSGAAVEVDDVIYATGYKLNCPFLRQPELLNEESPHDNSYLFLYPMKQRHPTLFTLTMIYYFQAAPGVAELMARASCAVICGERQLPSLDVMEEWLQKAKQRQIDFCGVYPGSVGFHPLREELSALIGCQPDLEAVRRKSARLASVLESTMVMPYAYRLLGAHANWHVASTAILEAHAFGSRPEWNIDDLRAIARK